MFEVAKAARSVDYVMALTWHRIEHRKGRSLFRRPKANAIGKGLEEIDNELTLESGFDVASDPGLGLRAAAMSAQRGIPLSIEACTAIAENFADLPDPWPRQSREDLVALIGAGAEMIQVFEALDQEGIIGRWIPEWEHVRFLPQRNVLHRHTVDRHMLETAVKAAALTRQVRRPDLLLIAALFHDIGKGFLDKDHSDYGAELMIPLAMRLGFSESDAATLELMVKQHLLLSAIATRRDLDDPATIASVLAVIPDLDTLQLLHALSIADGEATGKAAWSAWKATLVQDLVYRCTQAMQGVAPAKALELSEAQLNKVRSGKLSVEIRGHEEGYEIEIVSPDRMGLLSVVAGVLSISRMDLRSARTRTVDDVAVMRWLVALDVHAPQPGEDQLLALLQKALDGDLDINAKIEERIRNFRRFPGIPVPPPVVSATNDIATDATILEVRMHDQPGVLYNVTKIISRFGVDIRAAIVATLGAEAFDTLYITDPQGGALSEERAKTLATQIERHILTQ
jgi:[protein-PII] uridylyltransferase